MAVSVCFILQVSGLYEYKIITETIYPIIEYLAEYLKYQKNDMMAYKFYCFNNAQELSTIRLFTNIVGNFIPMTIWRDERIDRSSKMRQGRG